MVVLSMAAPWYHAAVSGRFALALVVIASLLASCGRATEKQWYKPNANYTVAEFEQDRRACTRERQLDEACLRQKGWVSLSADGPVKDTSPQAPEQPKFRVK